MARNVSGVYSPTAGIPVTSGTTISSTVFNNLITDIGNELTASMPVAGTAPMTGTLRAVLGSASAPGYTFTGDTNTGIYSAGADTLNLATGGTLALTVSSTQTTTWAGKATGKAFDVDAVTSVASATTTDIGAAATSEVLITGTTTITGFGTSAAGIVRRGVFSGALTLTHNATSLILPGGASITTAANDSFVARSLGSGNWIVTQYQKASGVPVVGVSSAVAGTGIGVSSATGAVTFSWPSFPTNSSAVGQWYAFPGTSNAAAVLPAGGTWAWFTIIVNNGSGAISSVAGAGVAAGGSTVGTATVGYFYVGFAWRIS